MIHRSPWPDVAVPDAGLYETVTARFAEFGDRAAVIDGPSGRVLSYAQLHRDIDRMAASLAARGFAKGDIGKAAIRARAGDVPLALRWAAEPRGLGQRSRPEFVGASRHRWRKPLSTARFRFVVDSSVRLVVRASSV